MLIIVLYFTVYRTVLNVLCFFIMFFLCFLLDNRLSDIAVLSMHSRIGVRGEGRGGKCSPQIFGHVRFPGKARIEQKIIG